LVFVSFPIIAMLPLVQPATQLFVVETKASCLYLADLFCLIQSIINFILWQVVPPLIVIWFAYAGFLMLTSGGDPGKNKTSTRHGYRSFYWNNSCYSAGC
jgi:hypothetical protein